MTTNAIERTVACVITNGDVTICPIVGFVSFGFLFSISAVSHCIHLTISLHGIGVNILHGLNTRLPYTDTDRFMTYA